MGEWFKGQPGYERAKRDHLAAIRKRETARDDTPADAMCVCGHTREQHSECLPAPCFHEIPAELRQPKAITKEWIEAMDKRPGCRCIGFCWAQPASPV